MSKATLTTPIQRAVRYRDSEQRFAAIAARTGAVWLDSGSAGQGRYEIITCEPTQTLCLRRGDHTAHKSKSSASSPDARGKQLSHDQDPFALARQWHQARTFPSELPFHGGVLGCLGYDLNQHLEDLRLPPQAASPFPIAWLGYFPWALVQDKPRQQSWLVADSAEALRQGDAMLTYMDSARAEDHDFALLSSWHASTSKEAFINSVQRIQHYIQAGDCYQVNLARHFQATYCGSPWSAYRKLRRTLPSPFSAYLNTGSGCLLSHSPERFLQIDQDRVITSPIKGTRPRSPDPESDRRLAEELLHSSKDRAENVMIVDLLRNDLGRSCRTGSVRAQRLCALESYANVHHLVSTIEGRLRPDTSPMAALKLAFPGGSITGAPKIRAMDIINELEPVARSAYCGSVFYYSNHGRLDSSITIRSVVADGDHLHCWGGGGIVADSDAEQEYQEGLTKIRVLMDTLTEQSGATSPN